MLLCFVDESCHADFYGFAAVVADEHQTVWLTQRLNEIGVELSEEHGLHPKTEIHAYPIFQGREAWAGLPPRVRVRVFEQVVDAVHAAGVTVLLRAVDSVRLQARQAQSRYPEWHPPEQVAFQHLLQHINIVTERQQTHALVIADERSDRDQHRASFALYQVYGTPGTYLHTTLDRLLDTVHFAPSHHSRMLQVADVLAFLWRRAQTVSETDPRQAKTMLRLMAKIEARSFRAGVWPQN